MKNFHDYLAPRLDTYEQAIYLYVIRHSRLIGLDDVVIGFKSARKLLAQGTGVAGSAMSEGTCYEKLRSLEGTGCIKIINSERAGTRVRAVLPEELGIIPPPSVPVALDLESMDFFNVPENRLLILKRESSRCFYCMCTLNGDNHVIEHVVSRPDGENGYRNVVAACRRCNNRKGESLV